MDNSHFVSKLFLTSMIACLQGKSTNIKLRGKPHEIEVIKSALTASKDFHEELDSKNASLKSVMDKLHTKQEAAKQFEATFSLPWVF